MTKKLTGLGLAFNRATLAKAAAGHGPVYLAPDAAGTGPAESLILVGDTFGRIIGELDADIEGVAWKLSDYGQARMTLARASATATERLLRPGNRVLIQFGNGLPDWGGVMDLPRRWRDGRVEVVAYSGEYLLKWRITGRGRYFTKTPAGEIFRALLTEAEPLGVAVGAVWMGGEAHSPDYHYRELYDIFTKSLAGRIETADWNVTAGTTAGRIMFQANYYERRGKDHGRTLALLEGVNAIDVEMQEQGPIINEWRLAGAGTGWGEEARIYATAEDETSQGRYGLRQKGEVRVDVTEQATLNTSAAAALADSKAPAAVVSLATLDRPPARWGQYDVGDTVWMELYEVGFSGYEAPVRLRAREFLPRRGVCSVVIE